MFEELSARLTGVFRRLTGSGRLTEENIREALREVRRALLEADVHFQVARDLVKRVEERAVGQEVLQSLAPGQQVIQVVHDELVATMGGRAEPFALTGRSPRVILLVGLQGVGKTTLAAKLGVWFQKKGLRPLLVAADTRRPAAADQLGALGARAGLPVVRFDQGGPRAESPVEVTERALERARPESLDPVIVDTQGRLHVDEELLDEVSALARAVEPAETLLVVDSMVGQDAVRSAEAFRARLPLTGVVLTKLDGDARGGAAISLAAATGLPIRLASTGEGLEALDAFHPDRMASRILGMGDVLTLVEQAQSRVNLAEAEESVRRMRQGEFTLEDFRSQLGQMRRMGPMRDILALMPGASALKLPDDGSGEERLAQVEAVLNSMTPEERADPAVLNASRRRRIARGSGTSVEQVNTVVRDFRQMERLMKALGAAGRGGRLPKGFKGLRGR